MVFSQGVTFGLQSLFIGILALVCYLSGIGCVFHFLVPSALCTVVVNIINLTFIDYCLIDNQTRIIQLVFHCNFCPLAQMNTLVSLFFPYLQGEVSYLVGCESKDRFGLPWFYAILILACHFYGPFLRLISLRLFFWYVWLISIDNLSLNFCVDFGTPFFLRCQLEFS